MLHTAWHSGTSRCQVMRKLTEAQTEAFKNAPSAHRGINMTFITMAPKCLDNLLPTGAGERHEADYPCFPVTPVIMYHLDGSTANTSWVPARPSAMHLLLFIRLPRRVGGLWQLASTLQPRGCWSRTHGSFPCSCAEAKGREGTEARPPHKPHGDIVGPQPGAQPPPRWQKWQRKFRYTSVWPSRSRPPPVLPISRTSGFTSSG